jgi:hypothetical protein
MLDHAVANRRAALLAHALPARDRAWLLGELQGPQREALAALIEELRSMRVPRDPALVRQLLDMDRKTAGAQEALETLRPRDLPVLLAVLRAEPPWLVARLLSAGPWPWRQLAAQELGAAAQDPAGAGPGLAQAARLDDAIVNAVWEAVQRRRTPVPVQTGWAVRLLASLRRGAVA